MQPAGHKGSQEVARCEFGMCPCRAQGRTAQVRSAPKMAQSFSCQALLLARQLLLFALQNSQPYLQTAQLLVLLLLFSVDLYRRCTCMHVCNSATCIPSQNVLPPQHMLLHVCG